MAGSLAARLRRRIELEGPLPFSAWMEAALYDPEHGFYNGGQHPAGIGKGTHFATSPTLHPFFAHAVARDLAAAWTKAGRPGSWEVVEFGAGTGALARDAMWELQRLGVPARWNAIDIKEGQPIKGGRWLPQPPPRYDAVVANEFLDALPLDVLEKHEGQWYAMGVGLGPQDNKHASFAWTRMDRVPDPAKSDTEPDGARRIVMPAMQGWLERVSAAGIKVGLIIDYGKPAPASEVRGFLGHDFADPLAEPGSVDITADVDFHALGLDAIGAGFDIEVESQERFLMRHGAFDAINRIDRTTMEGTSSYLRFRQLLLPTGFGSAFLVARIFTPES